MFSVVVLPLTTKSPPTVKLFETETLFGKPITTLPPPPTVETVLVDNSISLVVPLNVNPTLPCAAVPADVP